MSILFPGSIDSFTNPSANSDTATLSHSSQHANINDAVTALETKVGINSSTVTASIDYTLKSTSSVDPGHHHSNTSLDSIASSKITGITFPSGAIVGTTDTQALTNKTYNGLTLTATTGTITLTNSKTLTVSDTTTLATNAITLAGGEVITFSATNALSLLTSGATSMTFPQATDTVAVLGTAQTYTATKTEKQVIWTNNAIAASSNAATVPITHRLHTVTNNSAATLTITMTVTSAVDGAFEEVRILDFSGVAQTITWVNTENSTVTAPTTSNGSTTLPLSVLFQYNGATSKFRCIASS